MHDIGIIRICVCVQDSEEVIPAHNLAQALREIILEKSKKGFIADALTQIL